MCLRDPTNLSFRCGLKESTCSSDVKPQHPHPRIESQALRMEFSNWNRLLPYTSQLLLNFMDWPLSHSAARMAWSLLTLAERDMQSHPFVLRRQSVGESFGWRDQLFLWGDGNFEWGRGAWMVTLTFSTFCFKRSRQMQCVTADWVGLWEQHKGGQVRNKLRRGGLRIRSESPISAKTGISNFDVNLISIS